MTKKWAPSLKSHPTETKRSASKAVRAAEKREIAEMAKIADKYDLDPLGDFLSEQANR